MKENTHATRFFEKEEAETEARARKTAFFSRTPPHAAMSPGCFRLPLLVLVPVLVLRRLVGGALSTALPDGLLLNNSAHTGARLPKCPCGPAAFVRARKKKTAVRIAYTMVRSKMVPKRRKKSMVHPYITAPVAAVVSAAAKMGGPMRVMASRDLSWRWGAEEAW